MVNAGILTHRRGIICLAIYCLDHFKITTNAELLLESMQQGCFLYALMNTLDSLGLGLVFMMRWLRAEQEE